MDTLVRDPFFEDVPALFGLSLEELFAQKHPTLRRLRAAPGLRLHALSNYPVWYRNIEAKLRLSEHLEWSFVSCETGTRKPDAAAFEGAAAALGVPPGAC